MSAQSLAQYQQQPSRPMRLAEPGVPPLAFWIDDFLHAKAVKADKTVEFYRLALYQYQEHVGIHFWPPTDSSINSFLAAVKRRGCTDGTIHAYYRALRAWCNWLFARKRIDENPITLVEEPPNPRLIPRAPRRTDLQKLFAALAAAARRGDWLDERDYVLLSLSLDSGLRVGEVVRLQVADYDPETHVLHPRPGKTNEERTITLSDEIVTRLERWLEHREGLDLPRELTALFVSHYQGQWQALSDSGVRQVLERRLARAKLPHFRVHDLRHAFAIYSLRKGADLSDLQKQLGHKNISTTARYLKADDEGRRSRHNETSPLSDFE